MIRNLAMIVALLLAAALCLTACGEESEKGRLDNPSVAQGGDDDSSGDGGDGDGGIPGDCVTLNEVVGNWLALDAISGPFDDVHQGDTFVATGRYHLVSPAEVYVTGTICGTVCEETKHTPPLTPGTGEFRSEFTVVAVPDPEQANNCFNLTMIDLECVVIVRCTYHL